MQERFQKLPPVVQNAITSADVEKHLRELAQTHRLHLDQWTALENEVMLALLGLEPVADLAKNIKSEVGVDDAVATALASDISTIVFAPIRGELERLLEHPSAEAAATTGVEDMRTAMLARQEGAAPAVASAIQAPPVVPATPPNPAPTLKVERAPLSSSYAPQLPSHERKTVEGDPYREQLA